jgi:hypothetical protein
MPRYYRALLTTFLAGALAVPAFAQTPAAPESTMAAPAAPEAATPTPDAAKDAAPADATAKKPPVHKRHHHVAKAKATAPAAPPTSN